MTIINGKSYTEQAMLAIKEKLSKEQFDQFVISGFTGALTGSVGVDFDFLGVLLGDDVDDSTL